MIGIDLEYVPEDAAPGHVPGERPNPRRVYCEIMQIGACKLANGTETGSLNVLVQAHRIDTIPPWLVQMTGITQERRADEGVPFLDALEQFVEFCRDGDRIWTFDMDEWVLRANALAHGVTFPFTRPFARLKPMLRTSYGISLENFMRHGYTEVCSGGLYDVLGLDLPTIEGVGAHDAAHDARSLIYAVRHLENR